MSNGTWTTSADRIRFGATAGGAVNLTVDDVLIGSGSMPPPVASSGGIILAAAVPGSSYPVAVGATWTPTTRVEYRLSFVCTVPV